MRKENELIGNGCIVVFLLIITILSLCLPLGIIWLLNQICFNIEVSVTNYLLTGIILAAILFTLFLIEILVLKFKKTDDENSKKSN